MICPYCKTEYREGFTTCADCGTDLVNVPTLPDKNLAEQKPIFADPVFLCYLEDNINSGIITATLKNNDIPIVLKRRGAGGYLKLFMGINSFGADLYVPSVMLEKAQNIISDINCDINFTNETDIDFDKEVSHAAKNRRNKVWLILAVFLGIPSLIILILSYLFR